MKAMILAAGRGERMRPLTKRIPKPLLQAGGKSLIVWHIENLAQAGFKEIVINHAYLGAQIEASLGNGSHWGVSIQYSPEQEALETAGGIANAMPLLGDAPFVVINGDVFTDFDFSRMPQRLTSGQLAHLVLVPNPPQHPDGDFCFINGELSKEGEPKFTFSGLAVYHSELFNAVPRGHTAKLAPLLRQAIAAGQISAELFDGIWHDIGTPERLCELDRLLTGEAH